MRQFVGNIGSIRRGGLNERTAEPDFESVGIPRLKGISEIRTFFRTNEQPIFLHRCYGFNLLGIDRWVRGFEYIVYYDSWDGTHPRVFTPASKPYVEFKSSEEINNYLLRDAEVQKHIEAKCKSKGVRPMVAMVFFDEETEEICRELNYTLILPTDELRRRLIQDRHRKLGEGRCPLGAQRARPRRQL